jgi:ribose-phosphate pyrophosphokinase
MMSTYRVSMPEDCGVKYRQFSYPAGETQIRFSENQLEELAAAEKCVITARITNGEVMPLLLLLDAVEATSSADIVLILPYLPYSRADRRFDKGDCFGLKVFAAVLNELWRVNKILTFDAHSFAAESEITSLTSLEATPIIQQVLDTFTEPLTILMPDKGSLDRYDPWGSFKENFPVVHCEKKRDPKTGALSGFEVPEVPTDTAIIIDDICDGGGTFIGIAKTLKEKQPDVKPYLYVSHGIFSKGLGELKKYFEHVFTTNSFPIQWSIIATIRVEGDEDFITVLPIDDLIERWL